jgi:hypothetical protein
MINPQPIKELKMNEITVDKNTRLLGFPDIKMQEFEGLKVISLEENPLEDMKGTKFDEGTAEENFKRWAASLKLIYGQEFTFSTIVEYQGKVEMILVGFADEDAEKEVGRFFYDKGYLII